MQYSRCCTGSKADNLVEIINYHILKKIALVHFNYSGITLR